MKAFFVESLVRKKGFNVLYNSPGSSPNPGGGCADSGPGVLPEPGDLTSSFIAPPYESDELGGLCG